MVMYMFTVISVNDSLCVLLREVSFRPRRHVALYNVTSIQRSVTCTIMAAVDVTPSIHVKFTVPTVSIIFYDLIPGI